GILFAKPAWMLNGKPLPFLHHAHELPTLMKFGTNARQIELMPLYDNAFVEGPKLEKAKIKVEKINGPILLIAGKDGQLWPSYRMCQRMEKRLKDNNFTHPVHALYYDEAGHYVTITPELKPTIYYKTDQVRVGGTDSGNASAQADSWIQLINFLQDFFN
ncbi:MAG: dienelactone hydrolase family protein, partial [Bacteroidales bacterium]|nr:dienelactone hydrolase family protein [Bacteroidales bacterium]